MPLSLYTIGAENPFLRVLARAVLDGFPVADKSLALSHWTILVPNRRSARALEHIFLQESDKPALVLPRIKPIGDIDEDLIADSMPEEGLPDAISKTDHLHAILTLLEAWAETATSELAEDVRASGAQAFALAQSLQRLVSQFETEDAEPGKIKSVYDLDLAGHRYNILDLLTVVTEKLPLWLKRENLQGPAGRRNAMIRLEAERIKNRKLKGPIIAAGSTGTNPATRDLLLAIAADPQGAVILPGLDLDLDDAGWNAVTPEHPQYGLRSLLQHLGTKRADVGVMGKAATARSWLISEALRPAEVADQWAQNLQGRAETVREALHNVSLVECADRQQEAEVIALCLRRHVAESTGKAALVTPDRDLATRVKAALRRWNLPIDDSAGEPLLHKGHASLLVLLLNAVQDKFAPASLFALLHHPQCHFGTPRQQHLRIVRHLELAAFRGLPRGEGLGPLVQHLAARKRAVASESHVHPLLRSMSENDWADTMQLAVELDELLTPLSDNKQSTLAEHIDTLLRVIDTIDPPLDALSPADEAFLDVMTALRDGSKWHSVTTLTRAQHGIIHALSLETLRPPLQEENQLAIYGLAEARLVELDLAILGGLCEGAWPEHPDTGPWLNRPMRESIGLQQPERDIGLTAHDFVQAFEHRHVMVTWPRRIKGGPAIPSRWILRLQAVAKTAGLDIKTLLSSELPQIARQLDAPRHFKPMRRPIVRPPVSARPTRFSVTRIEKLLRDSYGIYVRDVLALQPLEDMGGDIDASLRGTMVHDALQRWTESLQQVPDSERFALLLAKGREVFQPYMDMAEVARFWWPRFVRMAGDFIAGNNALTADAIGILTETKARLDFEVEGVPHTLTARADRIDISRNGELSIIDYKTGALPSLKQVTSGFAPQLTLEAALARRKAFTGIETGKVRDVLYVGVGGGRSGVELRSLAEKHDVSAEAEKAFAGMVKLLAAFQLPGTAYIPVQSPEMSDTETDDDHLSRRREWQQAGDVT